MINPPLVGSVGTAASACPSCRIPLVTEQGETPWCERCEWKLDTFGAPGWMGLVARRVEIWVRRLGYRQNRSLFRQLASRPVTRPGTTPAYLALVLVSVLLWLAIAGLLIGGVLLVIEGNPLLKVLGAIMVGFAWMLRPRLGRLKHLHVTHDEVTRAEAPALFALIDQAAKAIGAPLPHLVFIGGEPNAMASVVGWRRRRVLVLGLALWAVLRPQERVALLGHELGHFVNHDNRRGLLTQPAFQVFGELSTLLDPRSLFGSEYNEGMILVFSSIARILLSPFFWLISKLCLLIHIGFCALGARDSQRSEYYADALAFDLAGSKAVGLLDVLLDPRALITVVGSRARAGQGAEGWRAAVEEMRARQIPALARLRQLTLRRGASLFESHPPAGLRHALESVQPYREAKLVLSEDQAAAIDRELGKLIERYRREIAQSW